MRKAAVFIPFLAAALVASCDMPEEAGSAPQPTRLERQLTRREKGLDAGRGKLLEAVKEVSPKAEEVPGPLNEFVGVDRMKREIQKIRAAVAKLIITGEDTAGLAAYCAGDHAEARRQFVASDTRMPKREFPAYFLGAMALQDQEYARAKECFSKVVAKNAQCRSAFLLRRLATLCQGRGTLSAAQLLLLFEQACREAAKELALDEKALAPSVANAFVPPLASDPVLFKAQELLGEVARRQFWEFADAFADAKTPEEKLGVALLMGDNELADTLVQGLAEEFRGDRDVQAFAFLRRHFGRAQPDEAPPRGTFAADLAAALRQAQGVVSPSNHAAAVDRENGALLLLGIPAPHGEASGPAPLTDAETALLARAARAKEFRTYAVFRRAQRLQGYFAAYGALLPYVPMTRVPSIYGHVAGVARRAAASVAALLAQGKVEDALRLAADTEAVASRAWDEAKSARAQLLQDAVADALHGAIQAHAEKAEQKPLLASCLDRRAVACRHKADRFIAWDAYLVTLFRMPVRRLVEAAMEVEDSPPLIHEFAALKLKSDPQRYFNQAMDRLADLPDGPAPEGVYEQIVLLGDVRNRNAVPRLITLAGHPDRLVAHLATKAFTAIAEGKE